MRRFALLCGLGAMALLALGCGGKVTVVPIKQVPEIDASDIAQYVQLGEATIGPNRLFIVVAGTAKMNLGKRLPVRIARFKDGEPLDTKDAFFTLNKPEDPSRIPAAGGRGARGAPEDELPPPPDIAVPGELPQPPEPEPDIEEGDPVQLRVDASTEGGAITKLVITAAGDVRMMP